MILSKASKQNIILKTSRVPKRLRAPSLWPAKEATKRISGHTLFRSSDDQVQLTIQDVSWAPEADIMTISFKATPKHPNQDELHSMWALDTDCYAGDIGDYGKFALLRELHKQGFSIGINWYKTEAITSEKQNDGKYCILDQFAVYDVDLSTKLKKVFYSQCGLARSIEALEAGKIIDDTSYFSEKVPMDHRNKWHQRALEKLSDSDLIFLDPHFCEL